MRLLGPSTSLAAFRWDLLFLLAQLASDERPDIAALAQPVQDALEKLAKERAAFMEAEDASVIATAILHKRDSKRDRLLVKLGGVARATAREVYAQLFPRRNPTRTAKLGIDAESAEINRILGELATLAADHPLRVAYEKDLGGAQAALVVAKGQADKAETTLALRRSQVERCKLELDKIRLETHGKLLSFFKDKVEADAFFRPTTAAPGDKPAPVEAAPKPPAPEQPAAT